MEETQLINKLSQCAIGTLKQALKVFCIGDPHFKVSNAKETDEMCEKIYEKIKEINPDIIVCLGDILDRHETIHVSPLTRATQFLKTLSELAPLYAIIGNHDRPNNSNFLTTEHPFNALKQWSNTVVVDRVVRTTINGHLLVFVPYVYPGRFVEALLTIDDNPNWYKEATAIFAHQEFYGAKMGVVNSIIGDVWPLENPLVISGHIHDYDELQSNLIYVGTPISHAWGDKGDNTVSVFNFYPNGPGRVLRAHFNTTRVDLNLIRRIIVRIRPDQVSTYEPPSNKLVKLMVVGTSAEIKAIMKLSKLKELQKRGVKVCYKQIDNVTVKENSSTPNEQPRQVRYLTRLAETIASDPELVSWYEKLFGKCTDVIL